MVKVFEPTQAIPRLKYSNLHESTEIKPEATIWQAIGTMLFLQCSDTQFWWRTTGYALAVYLQHANYPLESQYYQLVFFALFVAPALGPALNRKVSEPRWKSFMTDDNTPIELSWDWGVEGDLPAIRYSIEPIGICAGTSLDPFNQHAASRFFGRLNQFLPQMNLQWFEHFSNEFFAFNSLNLSGNERHETRFFAAFDLHQNDVIVKAYFFPGFKAIETAKSRLTVVSEALGRLSDYREADYPAFEVLQNFLQAPSAPGSMEIEMFAFDCIKPAESRFKIYVRTESTSFDSVKALMTLNGKLDTSEILQGLVELESLWDLLFVARHPTTQELPHVAHRTAGILYNFEIKPGAPLPVPKIYIPVRHYAQSDFCVIDGLWTYLQRYRSENQSMEKYIQGMKTIL